MNVHYSSKSNEWETPLNVFQRLDNLYNFQLDPCSTNENKKTKRNYTMKENGLLHDWDCNTFVNPPYGRQINKWVEKSYNESIKYKSSYIVLLIPARTDTKYWHDYIFNKAFKIIFIKGRLKFGDSKNSAPFPSAIIIFNNEKFITNNCITKFNTIEF